MSDVFEKNIARLVKESALPLTGERRARARAEFLRATEAPASRSHLRLVGVAAAVLIFCGVLFETTKRPLPNRVSEDSTVQRKRPEGPEWFEVKGGGGNALIQGSLRLSGRMGRTGSRAIEFKGQAGLPDGFFVRVHPQVLEEQLRGGILSSQPRTQGKTSLEVRNGRFLFEQGLQRPAPLRIDIDAPESLQHQAPLAQTKTSEAERTCVFHFSPWETDHLDKLAPQIRTLSEFAGDGRQLLARIEAACAGEQEFRSQEKQLLADAQKLQARAQGFAENTLYPAAANLLVYTIRDFASSMTDFKWKEGKFQGPVTYYNGGKPANLHRGDAFSFDALRRYLQLAELVAGREFDLWILRDFHRAGPRGELVTLIAYCADRPGVAEFAKALNILAETGILPPTLEDEIRWISK